MNSKQLEATPITLDSREDQLTASALSDYAPVSYAGEQLEAGDVWWGTEAATYGGEMKSWSDFLSSLWSHDRGERLEWQLNKLRGLVDVPFLAIHGVLVSPGNSKRLVIASTPRLKLDAHSRHEWLEFKVDTDTKWRLDALVGFLWSIQNPQDGGAPVRLLVQPTKAMLIANIAEVYWWSRKQEHTTFTRYSAPHSRASGKVSQCMKMLMAIDGVGEDTARALAESCGDSIVQLIAKEEKEILKIKGVGKKTIRKIWEALGCLPV